MQAIIDLKKDEEKKKSYEFVTALNVVFRKYVYLNKKYDIIFTEWELVN